MVSGRRWRLGHERRARGIGSHDGPAAAVDLLCRDRWEGNPHSRHHLMRLFTRDFEVLFVEGIPMRSIVTVDRIEFGRVWRKLRAGVGLRTRSLICTC